MLFEFSCCEEIENYNLKEPGKITNCAVYLNFCLENPTAGDQQQQKNRDSYPFCMYIDFSHNHSLCQAQYLRYLSVSNDTKSIFTDLFQQGYHQALH